MPGTEQTTATTAGLGAAFGAIVAWGLSLIPGIDIPVEIAGAITVICSYVAARLFGTA